MALEKFLDPKNDLAFKRIFGTEKNQDILIHFLNDILKLSKCPIQKIQYLPTIQIPEVAVQRMSAIDVLCQDQDGKRFIVEMQVESEPGFEKRAQYYAAKAYVEQRGKEQAYADLKSITFLAITSHTLFANKKSYLSHHRMLDIETLEHDLVEFNFAFLELTKFKKKKHELSNLIEKWAYFLKNAPKTSETDLQEIVGSDTIIHRAFDEISKYNWNEAELRTYDLIDMHRTAAKAVLDGAKAEGLAEGLAEGKAEGLRQGITDLCDVLEMTISEKQRLALETMTVEQLMVLRERLKKEHCWLV